MIKAYNDLASLFTAKGFLPFDIDADRVLLMRLTLDEHHLLYVEKSKRIDFYGVYFFSLRSSCKMHYVTAAKNNELIQNLFRRADDVIDFYGFDIPTSDSLIEYAKKGLAMI